MRIALISTPFLPVPPPAYGGTELVVGELALALREQGHDVVVYATGDSTLPGVEIRHYFVNSIWPPSAEVEMTHAAWCMRDIARDPIGFDVVHSHCVTTIPLARNVPCPVVHTLHHDVDPVLSARYLSAPQVRLVAISHAQAQRELAPVSAVVHHGLDPSRFVPQRDEGYLLFLGRYDRCKGPDLAIEVAERAGVPLIMAGAPHEPGFWEKELQPRLACSSVREIGPVGGRRKSQLIAQARALIFPVRWDEPFGLVMIESMLSGVPVLGFRRGSVAEVIDDGVTGALCDDLGQMVVAAREAGRIFDREVVRRHAAARWSAHRMAVDYQRIYRAATAERAGEEEAQLSVEADGTVANS